MTAPDPHAAQAAAAIPSANVPVFPASLPPRTPEDPRPTVTNAQANFHAHMAGQRAEHEARADGAGEQTLGALLSLGAPMMVIGGISFPPVTGAFALLLPLIQKHLEKQPEFNTETFQAMAMAHGMVDCLGAFALLTRNPEAYVQHVFEFANVFKIDDLHQLAKHINDELATLQSEAPPEPAKK